MGDPSAHADGVHPHAGAPGVLGYPGRFYLAARFAGGPEPRLSALADEVALSEETFLVLNAL